MHCSVGANNIRWPHPQLSWHGNRSTKGLSRLLLIWGWTEWDIQQVCLQLLPCLPGAQHSKCPDQSKGWCKIKWVFIYSWTKCHSIFGVSIITYSPFSSFSRVQWPGRWAQRTRRWISPSGTQFPGPCSMFCQVSILIFIIVLPRPLPCMCVSLSCRMCGTDYLHHHTDTHSRWVPGGGWKR